MSKPETGIRGSFRLPAGALSLPTAKFLIGSLRMHPEASAVPREIHRQIIVLARRLAPGCMLPSPLPAQIGPEAGQNRSQKLTHDSPPGEISRSIIRRNEIASSNHREPKFVALFVGPHDKGRSHALTDDPLFCTGMRSRRAMVPMFMAAQTSGIFGRSELFRSAFPR